MPGFKGIVRNVTLRKEDMEKLLAMPLDEIDKWSPVKVVILPKWEDVSRALAKAMIEKIKENNKAGEPSTFIIPAGSYARPPLMYPLIGLTELYLRHIPGAFMDQRRKRCSIKLIFPKIIYGFLIQKTLML